MLASLRIASRHTPSPIQCRFISSSTVRFPGPSHSMSDPRPSRPPAEGSGSGGKSSLEQPSSSSSSSPSSNKPPQSDQVVQSAPSVPSAAASPPPPPPTSETQSHPFAGAKEYAESQESSSSENAIIQSNLPALPEQNGRKNPLASYMQTYATPPFDTHALFLALEKTFPESIANSLMRATRALLVDRIGRVKKEALSTKDLENQAYLFRAALSEARNEISVRQRNDSTALRATLAALRREVDSIDGKMKSDIASLKHELQMDVDNRKTESKTDLKQLDIRIEELLNKSIVSIGVMRTSTEQMKWENMYRAVMALGAFSFAIVIIFEYNHAMKPSPPPPPAPEPKQNTVLEGLETQMT